MMRDYVFLYDLEWPWRSTQDREFKVLTWENYERRPTVLDTLTQGIYPLATPETP